MNSLDAHSDFRIEILDLAHFDHVLQCMINGGISTINHACLKT